MKSSTSLQHHPSSLIASLIPSKRSRTTSVIASARRSRGDDNGGGRQVDMNMIVLRKRIHEMKMADQQNNRPPSHWTHWEKECFSNYDSSICELIGMLQSELMNTRPAVALGIIAFVALSVPLSAALVFTHFLNMLNSL